MLNWTKLQEKKSLKDFCSEVRIILCQHIQGFTLQPFIEYKQPRQTNKQTSKVYLQIWWTYPAEKYY